MAETLPLLSAEPTRAIDHVALSLFVRPRTHRVGGYDRSSPCGATFCCAGRLPCNNRMNRRRLRIAAERVAARAWREKHFPLPHSLSPGTTRLQDIAEDMAAAFDYSADVSLDPKLAQLLRLRVAQMHHRSRCVVRLARAASDVGLSAAKIASLHSWRESVTFSQQELAALAYAEALTAFDQRAFATTHARLSELFDERDVDEITSVVIITNVWARFKFA